MEFYCISIFTLSLGIYSDDHEDCKINHLI